MLRGIARAKAELASQAEPLKAALILDVIDGLDPACPIACRDAAALALGYIFGRRRSELVGLDLDRLGAGDGVLRRDVHALGIVLVRHKKQKRDLEEAAHQEGLSLSGWMRQTLLRQAREVLARERQSQSDGATDADKT